MRWYVEEFFTRKDSGDAWERLNQKLLDEDKPILKFNDRISDEALFFIVRDKGFITKWKMLEVDIDGDESEITIADVRTGNLILRLKRIAEENVIDLLEHIEEKA